MQRDEQREDGRRTKIQDDLIIGMTLYNQIDEERETIHSKRVTKKNYKKQTKTKQIQNTDTKIPTEKFTYRTESQDF